MSGGDDWQPGDLALCVQGGGVYTRPGMAFTVSAVGVRRGILKLWFVGYEHLVDPLQPSDAIRFRKIKPLTDEEREEALREMNPPVREVVQ